MNHKDITSVCNTLMMSHVCPYLSNSRHHAWVCSAGSKGYCALKDMLQNGTVGHTLFLIESRDLRTVDCEGTTDGVSECCLVYKYYGGQYVARRYRNHVPKTVKHVTVYYSGTSLPESLLAETLITSVDLSPISCITEVQGNFLQGCSTLAALDLSALSQVARVHEGFLAGCSGLTSLDLSPLSNVTHISYSFLRCCTGLTSLDLTPLSHLTEIEEGFLSGCSGLLSLDLSPLCNVTLVQEDFLADCTGLTSMDLTAFSNVVDIQEGFLDECTGITHIDNPPPLCTPPSLWFHKADTNHWVLRSLPVTQYPTELMRN